MNETLKHIRIYIFRGLLAITPLLLSFFAIKLLYELIDKRVMIWLDSFLPIRQIPGMGILLVLICLYLIGLIVSNVIGRQIFHFIEGITKRIPLIKAVYSIGKQFSESISATGEQKGFQKAVLVDCNKNGIWTVAFITGETKDENTQGILFRVFVPTVPNPTTGFIFLIKQDQMIDPGWTIEEAIRMIVTAGIISPPAIQRKL